MFEALGEANEFITKSPRRAAEIYVTAAKSKLSMDDMMCHQANDFQVTEEEWQRLRRQIDRFHEDGRCVIFVGYEWSGMTPGGGDRNVMYRGDVASLHRSSHAEVDDMSDAATDCFPVTELFRQFRGRDDVMLIPHIGGRHADIVGFHDPALEPVVEIYSDWGRFEWLLDHTDPAPPRGRCHAYWIRVTQEDGAQAWTSPVYLDGP